MNVLKIILIAITIGLLITGLSYLIGFEKSLNLLRTLASIGTFIIAVIAFDKFGLKRNRKVKEVELVKEFYEKLQDVTVYGLTSTTDFLDGEQVAIIHVNNIYKYHETGKLGCKNVCFTYDYHRYFNEEIGLIVQNIFFPKRIKEKFEFIEARNTGPLFYDEKSRNLKENIYLSTSGTEFENVFFTKPIEPYRYKLKHILNNYKNLISETKTFLEENGYTIS